MATIYRVNGDIEELPGDGPGGTVSLEQAQKVCGGYVDQVRVMGTDGRYLVVNDEGLLQRLPVNVNASKLAGGHIVGDVLLVRLDADGDWF